MNKNLVYTSLLLLIGFALFSKKRIIYQTILKKYGDVKARKFKEVEAAVNSLPISKKAKSFVMAQILVETGFFSSKAKVYDLNTNASGIFYTGSAAQIANGATKGTPRPANEGGNYAKFNNLNDWVKEYYRVLNRNAMPLNASNIVDFGARLKQNNYFTDTLAKYQNNLNFFYKFLINNGF